MPALFFCRAKKVSSNKKLEDQEKDVYTEDQRMMISLIGNAYEKRSNLGYRRRISRYEAMESFLRLFDDMYPAAYEGRNDQRV